MSSSPLIVQSTTSYERRCSKAWANGLLRYGILVLKVWWRRPASTRLGIGYKIRLIESFIGQLENEGFSWQADRLANHLHRYLASLQAKPDTPPRGEEEVSS